MMRFLAFGDSMVEYNYFTADSSHTQSYLWGELRRITESRPWPEKRAFDLGCGNGATCSFLRDVGFQAIGVDSSKSGIGYGREAGLDVHEGSAYDDLVGKYGKFPLVISLEVIEHLFDPRAFLRTFLALIAPGGIGVISTPYHGYLKNLALAVSGKMDAHFTALWDGGHIKFFSIRTLTTLLNEAGVKHVEFCRVGRVPQLAKSMIAVIQT